MQRVLKLPVQMNSTAVVTAGNGGKSQFIPPWVPVRSHCWDTWNRHGQVLAGAGRGVTTLSSLVRKKEDPPVWGCVGASRSSPPSAPAAGARP